jgi:hypothetical protein
MQEPKSPLPHKKEEEEKAKTPKQIYVCMYVCMYVWMCVWMDGCIDGYLHACMFLCH